MTIVRRRQWFEVLETELIPCFIFICPVSIVICKCPCTISVKHVDPNILCSIGILFHRFRDNFIVFGLICGSGNGIFRSQVFTILLKIGFQECNRPSIADQLLDSKTAVGPTWAWAKLFRTVHLYSKISPSLKHGSIHVAVGSSQSHPSGHLLHGPAATQPSLFPLQTCSRAAQVLQSKTHFPPLQVSFSEQASHGSMHCWLPSSQTVLSKKLSDDTLLEWL